MVPTSYVLVVRLEDQESDRTFVEPLGVGRTVVHFSTCWTFSWEESKQSLHSSVQFCDRGLTSLSVRLFLRVGRLVFESSSSETSLVVMVSSFWIWYLLLSNLRVTVVQTLNFWDTPGQNRPGGSVRALKIEVPRRDQESHFYPLFRGVWGPYPSPLQSVKLYGDFVRQELFRTGFLFNRMVSDWMTLY